MGVHVLDVLVRPVEAIPEGQGGQLVEQIKVTAAGSAGGAALVLAKLGAAVRSAGAIGTDAAGDMLLALLERDGVDTSLLLRRDDVQTSASVLPIRPDGSRPAFHVVGANATYGPDDVDWDAIGDATHLHLGGPEFMGGEAAAMILRAGARARASRRRRTSSRRATAGSSTGSRPRSSTSTTCCPTTSRCSASAASPTSSPGARALIDRGIGCVAATRGADGAVVVSADGVEEVPAFSIDVVDTTGCGDAFSAGFLRGLSLDRSRRDAAVLGCAAAALVAQGLGSDHGDFDLAAADALRA